MVVALIAGDALVFANHLNAQPFAHVHADRVTQGNGLIYGAQLVKAVFP